MKFGSIPKDVKIFARPIEDITFRWDDIEVDSKTTRAQPAYVADATNKKTQVTGSDWANVRRRKYDHKLQRYVEVTTEPTTIIERPNVPMKNIRAIGLTKRGNGGRAYQVIFDDRFCFDMREDVMLDTMLNGGIQDGGILPGEYIFAAVNSEMKLIRVGSLLHEKMIESTNYNEAKAIGKLEIGGIYQNKVETCLYLGKVFTRPVVRDRLSPTMFSFNQSYCYILKLQPEIERHVLVRINNADTFDSMADLFKRPKDENYIYPFDVRFANTAPKSFKLCLGKLNGTQGELIEDLKKLILSRNDFPDKNHPEYGAECLNISLEPGYLHPIVAQAIGVDQKNTA